MLGLRLSPSLVKRFSGALRRASLDGRTDGRTEIQQRFGLLLWVRRHAKAPLKEHHYVLIRTQTAARRGRAAALATEGAVTGPRTVGSPGRRQAVVETRVGWSRQRSMSGIEAG